MPSRQVRDWVRGNDFFGTARITQGRDTFVPTNNHYPHIHIGDGFVVYSKTSNNHMDLIRGDSVYEERTQQAFDTCNDANMMQVCRYILSQLT